MSLMLATKIWGNGDEVVAVDEVDEVDDAVDDAEVALVVPCWVVVADEAPVVAPCTVEVTVLVTVFVDPVAGGAAGGAVEGAKRLLATEPIPAVTKTAPSVIATMRKFLRGLTFLGTLAPVFWALSSFLGLSSCDAIAFFHN
jgi:hypothetical protein